MLTYYIAFSQVPANTLTVSVMFGVINMYPLADAPCKGSRKQSAAPSTSDFQIGIRSTSHGGLLDTSSGRLELLRDISRTHELIRFVGCKTHHDLSVGLRMLAPYTDIPSVLHSRTPSQQQESMPAATTCDIIPIRHLPVDPLLVQNIVCSVIEMYVKEKLASRPKTIRNTERGRLEVGRKLAILENEFSHNPAFLRAFDVVRCRYELPLQIYGNALTPSSVDAVVGSMIPMRDSTDSQASPMCDVEPLERCPSGQLVRTLSPISSPIKSSLRGGADITNPKRTGDIPAVPPLRTEWRESSSFNQLKAREPAAAAPSAYATIGESQSPRHVTLSGPSTSSIWSGTTKVAAAEDRPGLERSRSMSRSKDRASTALSTHIWDASDDDDLEVAASELFWKDPRAATPTACVINYSLPLRVNSTVHLNRSLSELFIATRAADGVEGASEPKTFDAVSSLSTLHFPTSESCDPLTADWELHAFNDQASVSRPQRRISDLDSRQATHALADGNAMRGTGRSYEPAVDDNTIYADGRSMPVRVRMGRQHPSFASDQTVCDPSGLDSTGKGYFGPDEGMMPKSARRESEVWPLHEQIRQES